MAYYRVDFTAARNADWRAAFDFGCDLSGARLVMDVRAGGIVALQLGSDNGRLQVDATAGRVSILVPAAEMAALRPVAYRHDLLVIQAGRTTRWWFGELVVADGTTPLPEVP